MAGTLGSNPAEWRQLLPQLEGLPLLPCGAGAEKKAPVDPATGFPMTGWTTAAYTPAQITAMNGRVRSVGTRTGADADGLLVLDLDGRSAVDLCMKHGCDPADAETWLIRRDTDPERLKVCFRVPQDLWHQLGDIHTILPTREAVKDADGKVVEKGQAIEVFFGSGQIICLGEHVPSGGHYVWENTPADLADIPPEWWGLVREVLDRGEVRTRRGESKAATGEWRRPKQCPICGRNQSQACRIHRDGKTALCFHGSTFAPPTLAADDWIEGTDWRFRDTLTTHWGTFSKFIKQKRPRRVIDAPARLAGAAEQPPASEALVEVQQQKQLESKPAKPPGAVGAASCKPLTLATHEVVSRLPQMIGLPRLNVRTRDVHLPDRIISADEAGRLYLELSSPWEKWPKETTFDAVQHLAAAASFDPVQEELERIMATAEPLSLEEWTRLDQQLFNIDDPVAAAFLPRFFIGAVARVLSPGCQVDQTPVLIGPQGIGKTQTGRVLFGAPFFGDGLTHRFDVDDITRLQRVWALELSEVDGITRRSDQEALKAFLTRQVDIDRRKYGRGTEAMPRRSVFWGTSNGAPLRDLSGSRRFVCIALPGRPLPLEEVARLRPAIWARALERYRAGMPWHSTREEAAAITERNADHQQLDPWAEELADYVERRKAAAPIKAAELLTFLQVPKERQTPAIATRLRQVMESIGWEQRRPQINGRRVQGFYPRP